MIYIADLVRKTGITHKKEASRPFSDNCSEKEGFRIAVKRTRPGMLDDAVKSAMQEECISMTANKKRDVRYPRPPVYHIPSGTQISVMPDQ